MGGIVQHRRAIRQARISRMPKSKRIVLADPSAAAVLLDEYSKKRAFDATPEPAPAPAPGEDCSFSWSRSTRRASCTTISGWSATACSSPGPFPRPVAQPRGQAPRGHDRGPPYDYASFEGVIPPSSTAPAK